MIALEKIPDQVGYLVIAEDGAVLASGGELENSEHVANVVTALLSLTDRLGPEDDAYKKLSGGAEEVCQPGGPWLPPEGSGETERRKREEEGGTRKEPLGSAAGTTEEEEEEGRGAAPGEETRMVVVEVQSAEEEAPPPPATALASAPKAAPTTRTTPGTRASRATTTAPATEESEVETEVEVKAAAATTAEEEVEEEEEGGTAAASYCLKLPTGSIEVGFLVGAPEPSSSAAAAPARQRQEDEEGEEDEEEEEEEEEERYTYRWEAAKEAPPPAERRHKEKERGFDWYRPRAGRQELSEVEEALLGEPTLRPLPTIRGARKSVVQAWEEMYPTGTVGPEILTSFWDFWNRFTSKMNSDKPNGSEWRSRGREEEKRRRVWSSARGGGGGGGQAGAVRWLRPTSGGYYLRTTRPENILPLLKMFTAGRDGGGTEGAGGGGGGGGYPLVPVWPALLRFPPATTLLPPGGLLHSSRRLSATRRGRPGRWRVRSGGSARPPASTQPPPLTAALPRPAAAPGTSRPRSKPLLRPAALETSTGQKKRAGERRAQRPGLPAAG